MNENEMKVQLPNNRPFLSDESSNSIHNNQEQLQDYSTSIVVEETEVAMSPHLMVNVSSSPVIRESKYRGKQKNRVVRNLITSNFIKPTTSSSVFIHPIQFVGRKSSQMGMPYEENMLKYIQIHKAAILASNSQFQWPPRSSFSQQPSEQYQSALNAQYHKIGIDNNSNTAAILNVNSSQMMQEMMELAREQQVLESKRLRLSQSTNYYKKKRMQHIPQFLTDQSSLIAQLPLSNSALKETLLKRYRNSNMKTQLINKPGYLESGRKTPKNGGANDRPTSQAQNQPFSQLKLNQKNTTKLINEMFLMQQYSRLGQTSNGPLRNLRTSTTKPQQQLIQVKESQTQRKEEESSKIQEETPRSLSYRTSVSKTGNQLVNDCSMLKNPNKIRPVKATVEQKQLNITGQQWHVHQSPRSSAIAVDSTDLNQQENIDISFQDDPKQQVEDQTQIEDIQDQALKILEQTKKRQLSATSNIVQMTKKSTPKNKPMKKSNCFRDIFQITTQLQSASRYQGSHFHRKNILSEVSPSKGPSVLAMSNGGVLRQSSLLTHQRQTQRTNSQQIKFNTNMMENNYCNPQQAEEEVGHTISDDLNERINLPKQSEIKKETKVHRPKEEHRLQKKFARLINFSLDSEIHDLNRRVEHLNDQNTKLDTTNINDIIMGSRRKPKTVKFAD